MILKVVQVHKFHQKNQGRYLKIFNLYYLMSIDNYLISDILGFIGIFFLSIRFFPPIIYEIMYIKKEYNSINAYFIVIEMASAFTMMMAAIFIWALPFIFANLFSLIFCIVLVIIHYIIKPFCVSKSDKK